MYLENTTCYRLIERMPEMSKSVLDILIFGHFEGFQLILQLYPLKNVMVTLDLFEPYALFGHELIEWQCPPWQFG